MRPNFKKEVPSQRPLHLKLTLRNTSKQPLKKEPTPSPPPPTPTPSKLSKEFIIQHSMFWKQEVNNFSQIKSLILSDMNLPSFESNGDFNLLQLSNIELLSLSKNNIISLHPLAELDTLIQLNLNNNLIFDLSPLSFLEKLESLYLNNNKVNNLEPLYHLPNLKSLHLYNNLVPYREKLAVIGFCSRLAQIDIEKNEVYREEERSEWLGGKIRKFNGEPVSVKMKNQIQMGSTAQSFGRFSSVAMSRPSTARPNSSRGVSESPGNDLQSKVEQLQHVYLRLDNQYQDQIVTNVRLKQELALRQQKKRIQEQKSENREELLMKIQSLRGEVSSLKKSVFDTSSPELRQLFELTLKYERSREALQNKETEKKDPGVKVAETARVNKERVDERPFHADQEMVFDSDSEEMQFQNSDQEMEYILRKNEQELDSLKAQLSSFK